MKLQSSGQVTLVELDSLSQAGQSQDNGQNGYVRVHVDLCSNNGEDQVNL